ILSICFFGAFLLAIYRAKINRHAIVIAFLVLSWVSAGVSMISLIINFREQFSSSTLDLKEALRRLCNADVIMTTFFWTVIPEVLRVLITVGQITKEEKEVAVVSDISHSKVSFDIEAAGVHENNEGAMESSTVPQVAHCQRRIWKAYTFGSTCIFFTPLVTSAAMVILSISDLAQSGWTVVHANEFNCTSFSHRTIVLFSLLQLGLASVLAMGTVMVYLVQHRIASDQDISSRFGNHLIVKMLIMSALTGVGVGVQWYSMIHEAEVVREHQLACAIYMITFPLLTSCLFVEREVRKEWRTWIPTFHTFKLSRTG
ncbi:hypothetical protein CROQUDRAFT_50863, partial [Cronartium quercuum f. sp. fusiforme G11]